MKIPENYFEIIWSEDDVAAALVGANSDRQRPQRAAPIDIAPAIYDA